MKNTIFIWLLFIGMNSNAQDYNTFSNFFPGVFPYDIVELTDSTFVFFEERNYVNENFGTRCFRLKKNGDFLDSASFFLNTFGRINQFESGATISLNDSTFISGFNTITQGDRRVLLFKTKIVNSIDSLSSVLLQITPPDSFFTWNSWRHYRGRSISKLKNGNALVTGELFGQEGLSLAYFVEVNENLDVVNTFYVFDSIFGLRTRSCQQLNDGTFIISGRVFHHGSLFQQLQFSSRAFVARIDTMGNVLWRDIIRHGAPSNRNFWVEDRDATFELTSDSTIGLAYFQHLACRDSATTNSCRGAPIDQVVIGRYRFLSYDLDGNILLDKPISKSNLITFRGGESTIGNIKAVPKGGGYIFAGNYTGKARTVGFIYRFDENGDSLWWREPSLRLQNNLDQDFLRVSMVKETSDGGFIGVGHIDFLLSLASQQGNLSRSFVFKLDSNGCYEPGICPNSMLGVDERVFSSVDGVKIYPNPAERILFVELEGIRGECRVVLRNMQGQSISTQSLDDTYGRNAKTEFDVQHIAAGMYLIEVHGEQGLLHTKKVVIK
jgi:hypothetical protein